MRTADSSEQLATLQRNTKWREKNALNGGKRSSLTFLCQPLPKSPSSAPREIHSARISLRGKGERSVHPTPSAFWGAHWLFLTQSAEATGIVTKLGWGVGQLRTKSRVWPHIPRDWQKRLCPRICPSGGRTVPSRASRMHHVNCILRILICRSHPRLDKTFLCLFDLKICILPFWNYIHII